MYYLALATDYDGTLAHDGIVTESSLAALKRLKETGRKLVMVTGRELPDLKRVFPDIDLFDKVVVENGALLYTPASKEERPIGAPPPPEFVAALEARGVPLSVGRSIVATWEPHQVAVLETIRELGLGLDIIFNKGAVMVLPSGINKAAGLAVALADLGLSAHNVVAIGDAENDHAFMKACGCSVAVANALDAVKDTADLVTEGKRGDGLEELVDALVARDFQLGITRRDGILLGADESGQEVQIWPTEAVLIAGTSGIGKSTLATALTERFAEKAYQFLVFDPEGDYSALEGAVVVGDGKTAPSLKQALELLEKPDSNVVLSTLALDVRDRPDFFADAWAPLGRLRSRTARPHWLIIDEAHHLLPRHRDDTPMVLSMELPGTVLITVHPDAVAPEALKLVSAVVALGPEADKVIEVFCRETGLPVPEGVAAPDDEHVLFWRPKSGEPPCFVLAAKPKQARKRHSTKYAEGELDAAGSFYFRGPDDAMNLRIHNLMMFVQVAEGIDEPTFMHHLKNGDYSAWFRKQLRDNELADETVAIENDAACSPDECRERVIEAVRRRYTAPAAAA